MKDLFDKKAIISAAVGMIVGVVVARLIVKIPGVPTAAKELIQQ